MEDRAVATTQLPAGIQNLKRRVDGLRAVNVLSRHVPDFFSSYRNQPAFERP